MATEVTKRESTYRFLMRVSQAAAILSACVLALIFSSCARFIRPPEVPPEAAVWVADSFMGDYEGSYVLDTGDTGPIVAQVIALGNGQYRANLMPEFDRRYSSVPVVEGQRSGTAVRFSGEIDVSNWGGFGFVAIPGQIEGETFAGSFTGDAVGTFELQKVERLSPTLGKEQPPEAVVLFDGTNLDEWVHPVRPRGETGGAYQTKPAGWKLIDGAMEVVPRSGDIVTKKKFTDFELHVEFRTPFMPAARGQGRGNSGVYLQGRYEVQVLGSYGLEGQDTECGGIYKVSRPRVNMCAPPLQWQTYDITFRAPRFDEDGNKTGNVRLTVLHNGVKIHDNIEIPEPTGAARDRVGDDVSQPGGISLQEHGHRVQYRNIWLVESP